VSEYEHSSIEKKWQDYWEKNNTFKVGNAGEKKLYCLDMLDTHSVTQQLISIVDIFG